MHSRQRGSMLVLGIGMLLVLTSFAVLAFDVGRIYIVRNEMQDVADAAALAGANCLTRQSDPGSTVDCVSTMGTSLNWDRAAAKAQDELGHNTAANVPISTTDSGHQIDVGYWNLLTHAPTGGTFSTTYTPLTANDRPAVRVSITKDTGVNNGPIALLTRLMFGGTSDVPMHAQAVAVISAPTTAGPGSVIPQMINKCMFDRFWNSTTNQPVRYTGSAADIALQNSFIAAGINVPQTIGQPWEIRIGSSYHYPGCDAGQWTTFTAPPDANASRSAQQVNTLIEDGNPNPLNIGDQIYAKPGTSNVNYQTLDATYPTPPGADVTVIVVDTPDLSTTAPISVIAFAGFHIDDVKQSCSGGGGSTGACFYIQGHFIPSNVTTAGSGIGPFYGTYTPPRLGY